MPSDVSIPASVLFVDDDADVRKSASLLLSRHGFVMHHASSPQEAWSVLASEQIDVVLLDLNFGPGATSGAQGLEWLAALVAHDSDAVVVVATGHSGINVAVAAMRAGASDFVMKPWRNDRLVATLKAALAIRRDRRKTPMSASDGNLEPVVGESPAIRRVVELLRRAAPTDAPLLLIGESGTGKTLLAQTVHRLSPRRATQLVTIDPTAAWREGTLVSALSTVSSDSTLVLDEIAGLPVTAQAMLAAGLPGARLVATTRRPRPELREAVQSDLLHRFNTVEITLNPLRERGNDVRLLAEHFLRLFCFRYGRCGLGLSATALDAIAAHSWPDNVRELRLAIERGVVLATADILSARDIPLAAALSPDVALPPSSVGDLNLALSERAIIEAALRRHGFNITHAAKELGLTRTALYRRMSRHRL